MAPASRSVLCIEAGRYVIEIMNAGSIGVGDTTRDGCVERSQAHSVFMDQLDAFAENLAPRIVAAAFHKL